MDQPSTSQKIKVATFGLSHFDKYLLYRTIYGDDNFLSKNFELVTRPDGTVYPIAIFDLDSHEGQRSWYALNKNNDPMPIKVAYSSGYLKDHVEPYMLTKPFASQDFRQMMLRAHSQLQELAPKSQMLESTESSSSIVHTSLGQLPDRLPAQESPSDINMHNRYQLKRWPNFKKFDYTPQHVKIAVSISKKYQDIRSLSMLSGLSLEETTNFILRCHELDYLAIAPNSASRGYDNGQQATSQGPKKVKQSFLQKIRQHLGL